MKSPSIFTRLSIVASILWLLIEYIVAIEGSSYLVDDTMFQYGVFPLVVYWGGWWIVSAIDKKRLGDKWSTFQLHTMFAKDKVIDFWDDQRPLAIALLLFMGAVISGSILYNDHKQEIEAPLEISNETYEMLRSAGFTDEEINDSANLRELARQELTRRANESERK